MITPPHFLKKDECLLLIGLAPDGAGDRYKRVETKLKDFDFHVIDTLGVCVFASVIVDNPSTLVSPLLEIFERMDFCFVTSNSDKGVNYRVIRHRAQDDTEVSLFADVWRPPWKK